MCYKSANVANVANLANVLQIGIGRILFLLESTKLSQPDKIIGIRAINIVFIIDIVEPNGFKGLEGGGSWEMLIIADEWGGVWPFSYFYSEI